MENLGMIAGPSFEEIEECHSSEFGENLLHDFGVQSETLDPSYYFIPWITIDHVRILRQITASIFLPISAHRGEIDKFTKIFLKSYKMSFTNDEKFLN